MSKATVMICSKLATALILNNPMASAEKVTIRGVNSAPRGKDNQPIFIPYAVTEVDADFWTAWEAAHGEKSKNPFPAIKSGAIFLAKSLDHAKGIAKEQRNRMTGFEGMLKEKDPRMGVQGKELSKVED